MSKVMLVMDMPESCAKCRLSIFQGDYCTCMENAKQFRYKDNKPDWCPLREVPKKMQGRNIYTLNFCGEYINGYNACIDEILSN